MRTSPVSLDMQRDEAAVDWPSTAAAISIGNANVERAPAQPADTVEVCVRSLQVGWLGMGDGSCYPENTAALINLLRSIWTSWRAANISREGLVA